MLKLSHRTLILISGMIWMAVGLFLLPLGLNFLYESTGQNRIFSQGHYPLVEILSPYMGGLEQTALLLIAIGLFIGYFKGRYVLGKSVYRGIARIRSFPNPTSLGNIYSAKYYILLGSMIGLGVLIKYTGISKDIRGLVDVAIGSALINGAMLYFREAFSVPALKESREEA